MHTIACAYLAMLHNLPILFLLKCPCIHYSNNIFYTKDRLAIYLRRYIVSMPIRSYVHLAYIIDTKLAIRICI